MDLMDMIKGAVGKQIMGQIGGMLGTDEKKTSSVFETAAGSILGGLIKKSSSPEGARDVFDMAKKQDDGILDKLGDILDGDDDAKGELEKQGGGILDGVFGSAQSGGISGILAKVLGIDEKILAKLLKFVAPLVMGVIGRQIKSKGMDAAGLGGFLGQQKKSLAFMPASVTEGLGFGNMLGDVSDSGNAAAGAMSNAGNAVKSSAVNSASTANGGMAKLIVPILVLVAIAVCLWMFVLPIVNGGNNDSVKHVPAPPVEEELPLGVELAAKFRAIRTSFNDLETTGIEGATSLAAEMKTLGEASQGWEILDLPTVAKKSAVGQIKSFKSSSTRLLDKQTDEIKAIVTPAFEELKEKLAKFDSN